MKILDLKNLMIQTMKGKKQMENKIIQIAKEMFNDEINIDSKIGDPQIWDSLGQLNLFMAIESNLNIKFSIDEIIQSDSIRKIVKLIENKTKEI